MRICCFCCTDADEMREADETRHSAQDGVQVQDLPEGVREAESARATHQGAHRRETVQGEFSDNVR